MSDTLFGATKKDVAVATIIGIFILIGAVVTTGAFSCTDTCPVFSQDHFDRFVDLIMYLAFGGAIFIGIRSVNQARNNTSEKKTDE